MKETNFVGIIASNKWYVAWIGDEKRDINMDKLLEDKIMEDLKEWKAYPHQEYQDRVYNGYPL